jgi:hypothetical protein
MSDFPLLLASEMGVTRRTVTRWCTAGKVPGAYRTNGGHWRLRKPRRIERCWGRYDDKIMEFVVRYTSVPGSPVSARQARQLNKIARWLDENKLVPAAASILRRLVRHREDNTPLSIDWQFAEETEKLFDRKDFNDALEFSLVAAGISDADKLPMGWKNIPMHPMQERRCAIWQDFKFLKKDYPKKYDLLTERDMPKMMHPRFYEATATRDGMLMTKAVKLRLNLSDVTPESLASELRISVATLYRRYGREAVRHACRPVPVCDESPTSVRYQLS